MSAPELADELGRLGERLVLKANEPPKRPVGEYREFLRTICRGERVCLTDEELARLQALAEARKA